MKKTVVSFLAVVAFGATMFFNVSTSLSGDNASPEVTLDVINVQAGSAAEGCVFSWEMCSWAGGSYFYSKNV